MGFNASMNSNPHPRRSLGFWVISPWRHIMVSLWMIPMAMVVFIETPGRFLLSALIAIAADIVAARRAPEVRLKHEDITALLAVDRSLYFVTKREVIERALLLGAAIAWAVYAACQGYLKHWNIYTANAHIYIAISIALIYISVSGINIRNASMLPANEKLFMRAEPLNGAKLPFAQILASPIPFYAIAYLLMRGCLWAVNDWEGDLTLLVCVMLFSCFLFLLCQTLIPVAYSYSKLRPYWHPWNHNILSKNWRVL